jgi:23S rRNA pseudouridine1911/1915/1917 synthase
VREQYRGYALVELELKTGRTHQIRVHLSYTGNPIAGDLIYGGEIINEASLMSPPQAAGSRRHVNFARDKAQGQRLDAQAAADPGTILAYPALHAALLSFRHPTTQEIVRYTAPLHEPMLRLVRRLRQQRIDAPVATEGTWIDLAQAVPEGG